MGKLRPEVEDLLLGEWAALLELEARGSTLLGLTSPHLSHVVPVFSFTLGLKTKVKEKGKAEAAASDPAQAGISPGGPRPSWLPRRWAGLFFLLWRHGRGGCLVGPLGRGARLQTGGGVLACRCLGDSQSDGFPGESQPHPGVATGEELLPFKLPSFPGRAELGLCWPGEEINPGFPKPAFTEQFHSPRR